METIIGYHFTGDKLRNGDPVPPVGVWLNHAGSVVPCESGLHASEHPFDALTFAPGNLLHHVELRGDLVSDGSPIDKWVGRERKIIASIDAEKLLRKFACDQALSVIHLWDPHLWDPTYIVTRYLQTQDDSLRTDAWVAARDAARDASKDAAWAAARAAWDAARKEFRERVEKEFGRST